MPYIESPDMRRARLLREGETLLTQHDKLFNRILQLQPGEEKSRLTVELAVLFQKIDKVRAAIKAESQDVPDKI